MTVILSGLLRDLAENYDAMAGRLRIAADALSAEATQKAGLPLADRVVAYARQVHPALGLRQEPVLRLVAGAHPDGITHSAVSAAMPGSSPNDPNDYLTLKALVERNLVSKDGVASPHRYYLAGDVIQAVGAN